MEKTQYNVPEMEIINLENDDVIRTSGGGIDEGDTDM